MIYSYYYISPIVLPDIQGVHTVFIHERDGMNLYLTNHQRNDATLIGRWDVVTGIAVSIDAANYHKYVTAFENDGVVTDEDGIVIAEQTATDSKDAPKYHGQAQRNMQTAGVFGFVGDPRYPAARQPYIVTMERFEDLDGTWPGWYWAFIVEFDDPDRAPDARAVGIYDADWNYLYTTGKLTLQDFSGPPDEDGEPTVIQKYATICPPGRQTAVPEDVHYALLLGSNMEGKMILKANSNSQKSFFWEV